MRRRDWVALLGSAALAGCVGSAGLEPQVQLPPPAALPPPGSAAEYVQTASGMVFPGAVGDFRRGRVERFKDDGTDEAASYVRSSPPGEEIQATVQVLVVPPETYAGVAASPSAEQVCALHFVEMIALVDPQAELIDQGQLELTQGEASYAGRKVTLGVSSGDEGFFGATDVPLRTELYLFCGFGGDWMVKHRFTYRADYDASAAIADFMADLTLTVGEQDPAVSAARDLAPAQAG